MSIARFAFPTAIHFGPGARALAAPHLAAVSIKRPLIVTDRGVGALPILARFRDDLVRAGLATVAFDGVAGNPVKAQVVAGVQAYRAHAADAVIGFGGGSALDVAKAVALMATHPGDLFDYAFAAATPREISAAVAHFIALPTTAGTGSEAQSFALISDAETHVKMACGDKRAACRIALGAVALHAWLRVKNVRLPRDRTFWRTAIISAVFANMWPSSNRDCICATAVAWRFSQRGALIVARVSSAS